MALDQIQESMVRRYEYDDRTVIVADLGPDAEPEVEVLGRTAVVVVGDREYDVDLPAGSVEAFNRNGVVTFEVRG